MTMYSESLRAFLRPVLPYLDDPSVTEIMINGPEDVWIERKGKISRVDARFSEEGLLGAARNMAQFVGRPLTDERPRLDARLPDGSRIHVVLPPISRRGTTIAIRKFFRDKLSMDALLDYRSLTGPMAQLIEAAIHTRLNILVSGGTGSGKTTLLNIISSLIPNEERILTIEDSAELQLNQTHLVAFESRPPDKFGKGGVDIGDLLHSALRLRPDRIVVGEVRGGEAFHLMQAMNTGHGGTLSTTHANNPTDALRRLESLCLMSAVELPLVAVRAQVASAVNLIISCERLSDGTRKVTHISEVLPLNDRGEYRTQDLFVFTPVAKDSAGNVVGFHGPTGLVPRFAARARANGFEALTPAFFDPATYEFPPPPQFAVGEDWVASWAPSLKHREKGVPDPQSFEEAWRAFERRLKMEAAADTRPSIVPVPAPGHAAVTGHAAPAGSAGANVAGPGMAGPGGGATARSAAAPPRPAPAASQPARPAPPPRAPSTPVAQMSEPMVSDTDKTPLPSRNPLLKGEGVSSTTSVPDRRPPPPVIDEPKVEISDDLLADEEAFLLMDAAAQSTRPPSRPSAAAAPRRPVRTSSGFEAEDEDPAEKIPDAEKTHIRSAPVPPRKR